MNERAPGGGTKCKDTTSVVHLAEDHILRRPQVMDSPKDALARIKRAFAGP